MKRFYRFVHDSATKDGNLLEEERSSWFSGDWLSLENGNYQRLDEHKVIATAYFAENTRMMAEMAAALGETNQAAEWAALFPKIREAFVTAYRQPDGSIYTGTQTTYGIALGMDMIADPKQREQTAAKFVEKLAADNDHLRTGFLGTPWLLPALTKIGRDDLAMRLLLNEDYPSWGFEIHMGATTVWERWNTIRANGEFGPADMNSFNHYAYGAVGDWMFQNLGGLQIVEPGYKKSRIAPLIGQGGMNNARCTIETPHGLLASEWKLANGELTLAVTVPANTSAEVVIPAVSTEAVREGNVAAVSAPGVKGAVFKDGKVTLLVGSGRYEFATRWPTSFKQAMLEGGMN
jgi:alpha-L-rhamnosidase